MIDNLFRTSVFRHLRDLQTGSLTVHEGGTAYGFGDVRRPSLRAQIHVHSPRLYRRVALGGALGAAESYLRGEWTSDDLPTALRVLAANVDAVSRLDGPLTRALNLPARIAHRLRRNSRRGSRRNIRDHYDLGNELFALFLDGTLTYSCAIFDHPNATLQEASVAKLDLVCRKVGLSRSDRVLEIGSGWGSFALHAAQHYGCHVTTTTISPAQFDVASARVREAGLSDRVTVLQQDYRDLTGTYDTVVSIEMIEAVGPQYLRDYFNTCSRLLAPDGQMLLQAIIMPEHRYDPYLRSTDFIQRYVFPGSTLTSIGSLAKAIGETTDFTIAHVEDLSPHYARTLRLWRERFLTRLDEVRALGGYDERFIRIWEYYLAYCEAGFAERCTGVVQMRLARPACRRVAATPAQTRQAMPFEVAV
jgi:cyclopropane-fatty-acyl-phospholipid synthase